ncbi:DUF4747 family protein [Salinarimonas sp.]|uniref:DUF4747 family protein n=1 Tax=Salinarimonas sp. TaxID=2766526 RepID=UPI0032D9624B
MAKRAARGKRITVGGVNVVTHPHSADTYIALFNSAFELKLTVAVFGEQRMLLSSLNFSRADEGFITGTIARFTEIDFDLPWFDSENMDIASENATKSISIPASLKPNYVPLNFVFFTNEHTFVFVQKAEQVTVSPGIMFRYLERLFASTQLAEKYGPVEITLIADKERLHEIVGIKYLRELRIFVKRPNPDDLGSYDDEIERRLARMRASSAEVVYKTDRKESLVADDATMELADVATRNGRVEASGYDEEGLPVRRSTAEHPLLVSEWFADRGSIGIGELLDAGKKLLSIMTRKNGMDE